MTDPKALQALSAIDFEWTTHIMSIWGDSEGDVADLHDEARRMFMTAFDRLTHSTEDLSPLGHVLVGQGGTGKTHLLGTLRKHAFSQGAGFILVDMTDVRDFWETVLQGYLSSLHEPGSEGTPQFYEIIEHLFTLAGRIVPMEKLAKASSRSLTRCAGVLLNALAKKDRSKANEYQDVVRALLLLASDDFSISCIGYNWLQDLDIEQGDKVKFGFSAASMNNPRGIVAGLSWLIGLKVPSILALDQLDSIVTQHHHAADRTADGEPSEEQRLSRSIIEGIGGGLSALRDQTSRTLTVVSCLDATWEILKAEAIGTFKDRFHEPIPLGVVINSNVAKYIVQSRLQKAYATTDFAPAYPNWPFSDRFFTAAVSKTPREILQYCDKHRKRCLAQRAVVELHGFDGEIIGPEPIINLARLDHLFETAKDQFDPPAILAENNDDEHLATLLQTACECLVTANPTTDNVDVSVDKDFPGGKSYPPLHARVRLVYRDQGDREKHLCLRALQRAHPRTFQARLKAAMTASGIDRHLSFRQLMVIRTTPVPGGAMTQQVIKQFQEAGGQFACPTEDELRVIHALQHPDLRQDPDFQTWLRKRRPVSSLPFIQAIVTWLFSDVEPPEGGDELGDSCDGVDPIPEAVTENTGSASIDIEVGAAHLPIGARIIGQQVKETLAIPLQDLTKHTVILAGSGSGKTVLVRRMVEEAALSGIPAIVIDGANDLARLGESWSTTPESWDEKDRCKAARYRDTTDVVVWTPGRTAGNPLSLEPLPDLAAVVDDPDELNLAADMARDALQEIVAPGRSQAANLKRGVLKAALLYFAQQGGGRLSDFVALLSDLPHEASGGISDPQKRASEMADSLRAEMVNNVLLKQEGMALDFSTLFGVDAADDKTRISVINFIGLTGLSAQQQFLNQLFMTLFSWIKKHPAPPNKPIRGLLVIDEAKDFVPSRGSTPCKNSLIRLAGQARKYGLGLILATQAPKSIDHNIIANCSTQFYGRANSPAAIEVIGEQLSQRGGSGRDIASLAKGQFYVVSESVHPPVKVSTPLCLSYHPNSPLGEAEVLERARVSNPIGNDIHVKEMGVLDEQLEL